MTSYVRTIREYTSRETPSTWVDVPLAGAALSEIVLFGHGKDADVMVELLDGRRFVMGLGGALLVRGCPGLESEVTRWDDCSLILRYSGEGLELASFRLGVGVVDEEEFAAAFHQWIAADGADDLHWAVTIEIEVVPSVAGAGGRC